MVASLLLSDASGDVLLGSNADGSSAASESEPDLLYSVGVVSIESLSCEFLRGKRALLTRLKARDGTAAELTLVVRAWRWCKARRGCASVRRGRRRSGMLIVGAA